MSVAEKIYQSVHDRWEKFAAGDFTKDPNDSCAFCEWSLWRYGSPRCKHCPANYALGQICYEHPILEGFFHTFNWRSSKTAMSAAQDVLELLEQHKDTIIEQMEE